MKAAIFYFTMSGNTELAAKEVAEATGAPLVRLHAEPPYTVDDIDWTHPDAVSYTHLTLPTILLV